jgi:hypothetical protein
MVGSPPDELLVFGEHGVDQLIEHVLCSIAMYGMVATISTRSPSLNIRFNDASSRLTVAGAEPSFKRSVLFRSTDVVVMSIAFVPPTFYGLLFDSLSAGGGS